METIPVNIKNYLALNQLSHITRAERIFFKEHLYKKENIFLDNKYFLKQNNISENAFKQIKNINWDLIDNEIKWAALDGNFILTIEDKDYPVLLKEINSPPLVLFVKGNIEYLNYMQIAMVGSRNPTHYGIETAHHFANQLAQFGFVITSGLAMGIDAASHEGALSRGATIAVLGNGLNTIYPNGNKKLAEKIIEHGALVSEFPLETKPYKENFPRRNRIISGLSLGVLVVEAALRSGSLITAKCAAEQGREVYTIPGSIRNQLSRGCHQLIRDGGMLIEKVDEIIEELLPRLNHFSKQNIVFNESKHKGIKVQISNGTKEILDDEHKKLLFCVEFEMTSVEAIINRSGFSSKKISSMLLMLELKNFIQSVPGGYCRI